VRPPYLFLPPRNLMPTVTAIRSRPVYRASAVRPPGSWLRLLILNRALGLIKLFRRLYFLMQRWGSLFYFYLVFFLFVSWVGRANNLVCELFRGWRLSQCLKRDSYSQAEWGLDWWLRGRPMEVNLCFYFCVFVSLALMTDFW